MSGDGDGWMARRSSASSLRAAFNELCRLACSLAERDRGQIAALTAAASYASAVAPDACKILIEVLQKAMAFEAARPTPAPVPAGPPVPAALPLPVPPRAPALPSPMAIPRSATRPVARPPIAPAPQGPPPSRADVEKAFAHLREENAKQGALFTEWAQKHGDKGGTPDGGNG